MADHHDVHRAETLPSDAPAWPPRLWLGLLACGVVASIALAIYIAMVGEEPFAIGLAVFGAVVMLIGALLGFGPLRRVP
jgi:hypothetical protein